MGRRPKNKEKLERRSPPARNPENRENQLIDLAYELAERRLIEGTATSQEIVHFLRLGTAKSQLEKKKLETETKLLESKKEAIDSSKRSDEAYERALSAFRIYQGVSVEEDDKID